MLNDSLSHEGLLLFTIHTGVGELSWFNVNSTAFDQIEHLSHLGNHAHVLALDQLTLLRFLLIGWITGWIVCLIFMRGHRLLSLILMSYFSFVLLFFLNLTFCLITTSSYYFTRVVREWIHVIQIISALILMRVSKALRAILMVMLLIFCVLLQFLPSLSLMLSYLLFCKRRLSISCYRWILRT